MSNLACKFIIYGDDILMGRVAYHRSLLPDHIDYRLVRGGGLFRISMADKSILFYGESVDFGQFFPTDLFKHKLPRAFEGYTILTEPNTTKESSNEK